MKEEARSILLRAFQEQRSPLCASRSSCLGVLKDYGGNDHPEIVIIADCLELGIPQRLSALSNGEYSQEIADAMARDLHGNRFYDIDMCRWAVDSWASTFGLQHQSAGANREAGGITSSSPATPWYYCVNEKTLGPLQEEALFNLLQLAELPPETLVWKEGMAEWTNASAVFGIQPPEPPPLEEPSVVIPQDKSVIVECPFCGTNWELEDYEARKAEFFCTECNKKFAVQTCIVKPSGSVSRPSRHPTPVQGQTQTRTPTRTQPSDVAFHQVSIKKLIVMSIFTGGFYQFYWFYRNFTLLKARTGQKMSPFAHALFSIFYCNSLFKAIKETAKIENIAAEFSPGMRTFGYIALCFSGYFIGYFSTFVTFLPLIGVQKTVALINEKLCPTANQNETFTLTNIITIVVCILFWILIVAATVSNSQQQQTQ